MDDLQIIGTGWAFPIETSQTGGVDLVSGVTEIEQAMHLILGTHPGERPMRPEFGCRLNDFIFASADATTAGLIGYEVRAALERWEPRVNVDEVRVTTDRDEPATLWIDVTYTILETYDRRNLVFPFYVIPDHE
jgi:phage baseplate assembly protein W